MLRTPRRNHVFFEHRSSFLLPVHVVALAATLSFAPDRAVASPPETWASELAGLESPLGIAARAGLVYVADYHAGRILKLSAGGQLLGSWAGSDEGVLRNPSGIAIDRRGDVFVADFGAHAVRHYTGDGVLVASWGSRGAEPGAFDGPFAVAVDDLDRVYVTDLGNQRVQKFTAGGEWLATFGSPGSAPGELADPMGIAVDARGDVWVADHGNHRVQRFAADGRFLEAWGSFDTPESYLLGPVSVAATNDAIYVTDLATPLVQRFGLDGGFVMQWCDEGGDRPTAGSLFGVAVDAGQLYVADLTRRRLFSFADRIADRARPRVPTAFAVGRPWPNPSDGGSTIRFEVPQRARLTADVFDVNGRHVRRLADGLFDPGEHRLAWDGRAEGGTPAPAGVYFVRGILEGAARAVETRVAIVR